VFRPDQERSTMQYTIVLLLFPSMISHFPLIYFNYTIDHISTRWEDRETHENTDESFLLFREHKNPL